MQTLYSYILNLVLIVGVSLLSMGWQPAIASAAPIIPHADDLVQVVQEIESLDAMRTGLAASLEGSTEVPTMETFNDPHLASAEVGE